MKKHFFRALIAVLVFAYKGFSQNVYPNSGAMMVTYSDVVFDEHPLDFEIKRTYNSKGTSKGWFGMGWSSNYETYLVAIPGGGIALYAWGGDSPYVYEPPDWDTQQIAEKVEVLAQYELAELRIETVEDKSAFKKELLESDQKRMRKWVKYLKKYPNQNLKLETGLKLNSKLGGDAFIEVLENGFKVSYELNSIQFFDAKGRLIKETDGKESEIILSYQGEDVHPFLIKDTKGNSTKLSFENDLLSRIEVQYQKGNKAKTSYKYDVKSSTLIESTDVENNQYKHEYDNDYNMTAIRYTDGRFALITYDPQTYYATSVTRKDGTKKVYQYPRKSEDEYGTVICSFDSLGKKIRTESNWYVMKTNELGSSWRYKESNVINGDSTVYVNNEKFEMPDTVYRNKDTFYAFTYNKDGAVTHIVKNGKILVSIVPKEDKLNHMKTSKHAYTAVFNKEVIEKFVAEDGTEVKLPITDFQNDLKGYKADIKSLLEAFSYTYYAYSLNGNQ
ncbi:DUF6531 domain-containing protein [Pedobacter sp. MW01-1-1]|uniref:DUF6531 domain-containing protein n=1 Tax=Pedobacter sp. MW01-1-1 TaxID=3383027 RepID=UPI003FEE55C9